MIGMAYILSAAYLYCREHGNDLLKEIGLSDKVIRYLEDNAANITDFASGKKDKDIFGEMENINMTPKILALSLMFYQEHAKEHKQGHGALGTTLLKFLNLKASIKTHHFGHFLVCTDKKDRPKAAAALIAIEPIAQGETSYDISAMTGIIEEIAAQKSLIQEAEQAMS